jgi:hypothetical protein
MSLQLAAQHLSSQGRGKDSTLVHMSPREVKSLNELAMAHGGQLSINPSTGLPEAGFLEAILPMAAGFALGPAGFGLTAMQAGLASGALGYAMTGSLSKGLMAGLGAYGGAGIGEGFASATVDAAPGIAEAQNLAQTQQMELANKFYDPASGLRPGFAEADYLSQSQNLTKGQMDAMANARSGAEGAYKNLGFMDKMKSNFGTLTSPGGASGIFDKISSSPMSLLKTVGSAAAPAIGEAMKPKEEEETKADSDLGQRYGFSMNPTGGQPQQPQQAQPGQNPLSNMQTPTTTPFPTPDIYGREQRYFSPSYTKFTPEQAKSTYGYADGGVATDPDRPTETPALQMFKQMQAQRAAQPQPAQIDANAQFNQYAQQTVGAPNQMQAPTAPPPTTTSLASSGYSYDPIKQQYGQIQGTLAEEPMSDVEKLGNAAFSTTKKIGSDINQARFAAGGGISHLGDYSDGGRLLRGPGDGVSDSIPAMIGKRQPARLADGEFVVPARIVSELGNGSTEAGARKLYAMMDRIQKARGKTVGKGKVAKNSRSEKYLPA